MIRLIASDHRFKPRLEAECTLCNWRARLGEVVALATVIARAQDHVTSQHDAASRPADEVGLPGVTDRVGVADARAEVHAFFSPALMSAMARDYEAAMADHAQVSDLHKRSSVR
jgi:hypothetical protein